MQTRFDPLTRALQEILDSVVTEAARDALVDEALAAHGVAELPQSAAELLDFIEGPLLLTLERALGGERAHSVVEELERWIGPLSTRQRPLVASPCVTVAGPLRASRPPPFGSLAREQLERRPTLPVTRHGSPSEPNPPASGDYPHGMARAIGLAPTEPPGSSSGPTSGRLLPLVFLATREAELFDSFSAWFDPRAVVVRMTRLVDLLLDIEDAGSRRVVIVVDCARASIRLEALAGVAGELPLSARVVLWGSNAETVARLCRVSPAVARWTAVPVEAPLAVLVERCSALIG